VIGVPFSGDTGRTLDEVAGLMRDIAVVPGRHVDVPGTLNFRDTGGYPVAGGGRTAWRRPLRSAGLPPLRPEAGDGPRGLGLPTVLDLRTSAEAEFAPSPLDDFAATGALTMHVSLIGDDLDDLPVDLAAIYDYIVDTRGAAIGAALRSLARPGGLPAL